MKAQTNQDAATHTPTPWEIFPDYEHAALTIGHYGKSAPAVTHVCDLPDMHGSQANAEFIVRAVNCYAVLVAALKMAEHDRRTSHWRAETSKAIWLALRAAK